MVIENIDKTEHRVGSFLSRFWISLTIFLGVGGLILALITYFILLEKAEVVAQILVCDELTEYSPVEELKGSFTYAGENVAHLWKITVKFVNTGDKTIVGVGSQQNIIGDGLNYVFPDDTRILRIEEETGTFQSTITRPELNHIQLQFRQWRSGEYKKASFYVASDKPLDEAPLLMIQTRDIVDGDMSIENLTKESPQEKKYTIDKLPEPVALAGKIMGGLYAGGLAILMLVFMPWWWKDSLPIINWKRRHLSDFAKYLDEIGIKISKSKRKQFIKDPYLLPNKYWASFDGPKPPSTEFVFESITGGIILTVLLLILCFGFTSLVLMLTPW